ncbi:isoprenylcysteine carboxylmethyltransferase family protein [candidate division KSB1 bacterium]|nr:isoprenylcysteine carboxylmethyltransferase family protein [candidate division KSB1 bacterium]
MPPSIPISVYLVGLFIASVIRAQYTRHFSRDQRRLVTKNPIDIILTILAGIGMFITPLFYIFTDWFAAFDYRLPGWLNIIGIIGYGVSIWILWRSHADLRRNWTPVIQPSKNAELVTDGIYQFIRHPMYAAHLLWALSQPLLLENIIAGWSFLVFSIGLYIYRIPREQTLLQKKFGDAYSTYLRTTGCLWPRF